MTYRPNIPDKAVVTLVRIIEATDIPLNSETERYYETLKERVNRLEYEQWVKTMEQLKPKNSSDESDASDHALDDAHLDA